MRSIVAVLCSLLATPAIGGQGQTPSGEAVYKQHCASCHEGTMPRMPSRATLKSVTPEAIETALSSFLMRRQGASLSPAERRRWPSSCPGARLARIEPLLTCCRRVLFAAVADRQPIRSSGRRGMGGASTWVTPATNRRRRPDWRPPTSGGSN